MASWVWGAKKHEETCDNRAARTEGIAAVGMAAGASFCFCNGVSVWVDTKQTVLRGAT